MKVPHLDWYARHGSRVLVNGSRHIPVYGGPDVIAGINDMFLEAEQHLAPGYHTDLY